MANRQALEEAEILMGGMEIGAGGEMLGEIIEIIHSYPLTRQISSQCYR